MDISDLTRQPRPSRPIVSYVRRSPRMTPSQRIWLEKYSSRWVVPVTTEAPGATVAPQPRLDPSQVFGREAPLVIEIGSGHGDTLVAAAAAHPETDYLGFEVFEASIARTLGQVAAAGLDNVRLVTADAVSGLDHLIADHRVSEVWIFFPDPWPKKRHWKRRLVGPALLDRLVRILVPGGTVRLATDWDSYAQLIESVFSADPRFTLSGTDRFPTRPLTKFERRGLAAHRRIHDFAYRLDGEAA